MKSFQDFVNKVSFKPLVGLFKVYFNGYVSYLPLLIVYRAYKLLSSKDIILSSSAWSEG